MKNPLPLADGWQLVLLCLALTGGVESGFSSNMYVLSLLPVADHQWHVICLYLLQVVLSQV